MSELRRRYPLWVRIATASSGGNFYSLAVASRKYVKGQLRFERLLPLQDGLLELD